MDFYVQVESFCFLLALLLLNLGNWETFLGRKDLGLVKAHLVIMILGVSALYIDERRALQLLGLHADQLPLGAGLCGVGALSCLHSQKLLVFLRLLFKLRADGKDEIEQGLFNQPAVLLDLHLVGSGLLLVDKADELENNLEPLFLDRRVKLLGHCRIKFWVVLRISF